MHVLRQNTRWLRLKADQLQPSKEFQFTTDAIKLLLSKHLEIRP